MYGRWWFFRPIGSERDNISGSEASGRNGESGAEKGSSSRPSEETDDIEESVNKIINEYCVQALSIGISLSEFEHLNPRKLELYFDAYKERKERELSEQNSLFHLQGQYFMEAIMSTVGNALSGKSGKKYKYPEKPYPLKNNRSEVLTEEELKLQREQFVAMFETMGANFRLSQKSKGDSK